MATADDALAFVRVSTGSQDARTQKTTLSGYAEDNGIKIVKTVTLHGYSASKGEQQPAVRDAIDGIRHGRWRLILVTDSSRLDRREDLDAQAEILLAIRQAGGDIVSVAEPQFGKTDFAGRISTLVAQYGNAEKSRIGKEQTWRGAQAIIANKALFGPLPPFWKAVGKRYERVATCTDPEAVRAMYQAIANGQSMSAVAREFDIYPQTVRRLVRNRANMTGTFECHYTHDGETRTWWHQSASGPVVDSELWHAANRVMTDRGAIKNNLGGRPVALARSWISGLLDCPRCGGHLVVLRGKSLRCTGTGKDRRSCGVAGIDLATVAEQIAAIAGDEATDVYRYQRVSGNQGELDELKAELERVRQTLAITDDDDEFDRLSARRKELREAIAGFVLVPDSYDMTPTGETLADLWRTGDKRAILKSLQRYIDFHVTYGRPVTGYVWIEGYYPGETLIELTEDTCIKMNVPQRP